ncbi:NCS2 family permease [Methylolobus aquaticus]|nr:NCS2 family permease [Methylolobus aquaticus]
MPLPHFTRGDLDGFFGLFVDNLLQLMLIGLLGPVVCGFTPELIAERILPGAALSVLFGNLFYARQARRLAARSGRADVTALPYGINTVSLLAFMFLVIGPVYRETGDPVLAWKVGLFACFLNAGMELVGAFGADWLRRNTPRSALLSALAGIALTFIGMGFVFQIYAAPGLALLPMMLILAVYASKRSLPLGLPGGLVAVLSGMVIAWVLHAGGWIAAAPVPPAAPIGLHLPQPVISAMLELIGSPLGWKYLAVLFPMGLLNIIGSLQNLESAEAAGDRYETRPSLLANGVGSLVAASFGSAFPTTIYIGHPAWKTMGAGTGYSVLNGLAMSLLCFTGAYAWVLRIVPVEATLGILLWIGLIITAQAFQETPRRHALAVSFGMVPSLSAWALLLIETALRVAGSSLFTVADRFGGDLHIYGLIALSQGFVFTSTILAAVLAFIIDRRFDRAAAWTLGAAALSFFGVIHAYALTPQGVQNRFGLNAAPEFAVCYAASALMLWLLHLGAQRQREAPHPPADR